MIVVEGPDGAGKTTLIEALRAETGLDVAPRVVSKDAEAMVDLVQWTEENVNGGFQELIFDRHRLISEPIYGPVLRDKPQPGFDDVVWFYEQLSKFYMLKPIIIYCLPPVETVWRNVQSSDDNRIFHDDPQRIRQIWGAYFNKAMTEHVLNKSTWIYDYTDEFAPTVLNVLLTRINKKLK